MEDKHPQPLVAVVCVCVQLCVFVFTLLIACLWEAGGVADGR